MLRLRIITVSYANICSNKCYGYGLLLSPTPIYVAINATATDYYCLLRQHMAINATATDLLLSPTPTYVALIIATTTDYLKSYDHQNIYAHMFVLHTFTFICTRYLYYKDKKLFNDKPNTIPPHLCIHYHPFYYFFSYIYFTILIVFMFMFF